MCGISGGFTNGHITITEALNIQKLLILNSYRGEDSTGMFDYIVPVMEKGQFHYKDTAFHKSVIHPIWYAMTTFEEQFQKRWKSPNKIRMISCHARKATQGDVTVSNAHPFNMDDLVGMHNGTVTGVFEDRDKFGTDSEAIYNLISKYGVVEGLQKVINEAANTAFALAWFDKKTKTMNLTRNYQRPLSIYLRAGVHYYSSDRKDLTYAFGLKETDKDVKDLKPHVLYSLNLDGASAELQETDLRLTHKVYSAPNYSTYPYKNAGTGYEYEYGYMGEKPWYETQRQQEDKYEYLDKREKGTILLLPDRTEKEKFSKNTDKISHLHSKTYENVWKKLSLKSFASRGNMCRTENNCYYDLATKTWYTAFQFSMLDMWKQDYYPAYLERLENVWSKTSYVERSKELSKCKFPPAEIILDKNNSYEISMKKEEAGQDKQFPFGVSGKTCSFEEYKKLLDCDCAYCSSPVDMVDKDKLFWLDDNSFLCKNCQWEAYTDTSATTPLSLLVNADKLGDHLNSNKYVH